MNTAFGLWQIPQDLNKIKKFRIQFCRYWQGGKKCEISAKILNTRAVGARQSFQIFRQNTGFSKTIEFCLNFCMGFYIT